MRNLHPNYPVKLMLICNLRTTILIGLLMTFVQVCEGQVLLKNLTTHALTLNSYSHITKDSFLPKSNALIVATIVSTHGDTALESITPPYRVTGNNLNWVMMKTTLFNDKKSRVTLFRAMGDSATRGPLRVWFEQTGQSTPRQGVIISVDEFLGANFSLLDGEGAIRQAVTDSGTNAFPKLEFAAVVDCANSAFGFFGNNDSAFNATVLSEGKGQETGVFYAPATSAYHVFKNRVRTDEIRLITEDISAWGGIGFEVAHSETGFPCKYPIAIEDNGNYSVNGDQGIVCFTGKAVNVNISINGGSAVFAAGADVTLQSVNFNSGNLIVNTGAKLQFNNGASLNGGLWVYGNLVAQALTFNSNANFYSGPLAYFEVNGDIIENANGVLDGSLLYITNDLKLNSPAGIKLCRSGTIRTNKFTQNNTNYSFSTGVGGGCIDMYGPNGQIGPWNGILTQSPELHICLPSAGVLDAINGKQGTAIVDRNCLSCGIVLPLKLVNFSGVLNNDAGRLQWRVSDNHEAGYFEVQHSVGGENFETIGRVEGGPGEQYTFLHHKPGAGRHFYRLKMVSKDGRVQVSPVVALRTERNVSFDAWISPTVTRQGVILQIVSPVQQKICIKILNMQGVVVFSGTVWAPEGNFVRPLPVTSLPAGFYFVQMADENGRLMSLRFMHR